EYMLRVLDQTGTDSQLRNQLSMVHRAAQTNLELDLGNVIPADFLYFDLADKLLQARILPRKVHEKTMVWRDQGETEQLMARACGLVFLINRLTRNNQEIGIKANVDTLADLMVSDLAAGSSSLRSQLPGILEKCELLMKVDDQYCIQTEESMAWHDEFESQKNILSNETHRLVADRDDRLKKNYSGVVGRLALTQGQSRVSRDITSVFDTVLPQADKKVQVWVRNGWNVEEDTVRIDAKQAGLQSPVIYVYIPKRSADDLRSHIIEYKASEATLDNKGTPITPEGIEARAAMETRKSMAETKINELLAEALSGAKVFQAGGNEVLGQTLKEAVLEAGANSLQRLYPQFAIADHTNWGTVYNKAQQGAPDALNAVGYANEPINHPVCKAILGYIAAGKSGNDIRNQFEGAPYGWSRDAVDGALLVLMIAGQVRGVDEHSRTIEAKGIERRQIAKLSFRVETVVVQIAQRLKVRKLYQTMGIQFEAGKETAKASDFLAAIQALANTAGGAPPQPARPDTTLVAEIQQKSGNEQLIGMAENYDKLMEYIANWRDLAERIVTRLPNWEKLQRLLRVEGASIIAADITVQVTAVSDQRLLLEEPDTIAPLLKSLEDLIRNQLHAYQQTFLDSYQKGMAALNDNGSWQKLNTKQQQEILLKCHISEPMEIITGTYEQLVAALQRNPLTSWTDRIAAMTGRFHKAIELAIKELEPEIQYCNIPRRTLKNAEDIDAWLQEVGEQLKVAVGKGPVIMR
nr:BREX system P-loop protein BrxC [Desulfitobacterium hafniense]